jgi:hypothetical protein
VSATLKAITKRALSQVGGYYPGKSPYGVWYDNAHGGNKGVYDAAQFCYMGLSWVFAQEGATDIFPVGAYTPSGVAAWEKRGQWHKGTKGIQPGDILYFNFPGAPNRVSHTGLALSLWRNGVDTIEFNTSGTAHGDQRNGRVVARKRRTSSIVGYGRPKYKAASAEKPASSESKKKPVILPAMHLGTKTGYEDDWQRVLRGIGFSYVDVDGSFGPDTTRGTKNFQASQGLKQDGSAGPITVSASLLTDGDKLLKMGDTGADVALLQIIVGVKKDSSFGPDTQASVKAVQRYFGIHDSGIVDSAFVRAYRKAAS